MRGGARMSDLIGAYPWLLGTASGNDLAPRFERWAQCRPKRQHCKSPRSCRGNPSAARAGAMQIYVAFAGPDDAAHLPVRLRELRRVTDEPQLQPGYFGVELIRKRHQLILLRSQWFTSMLPT
jgi:hypothetical protein